jgi:hypothetical protein
MAKWLNLTALDGSPILVNSDMVAKISIVGGRPVGDGGTGSVLRIGSQNTTVLESLDVIIDAILDLEEG